MPKKKYYTYILLYSDGKYYTGHSDDVDSRFERHRRGRGAKFTRKTKPVKIIWKQEFETELEAIRREEQIKGWTREKKERLIKGEWD